MNLKEINAFALPGGPMFVHRGMFDAAAAEGEVVGVMAHELSHVLLRHGTANASKAQNPWLQLGQIAGVLGGAVVGGAAGSAIAQGSQFGLGTLLLRYSRDFEKQADLLGAQIMARAGYDPRALARMFETIERESQGAAAAAAPQWMSSHPNPGNRTQYITKEAELLTIASARPTTSEFEPIKTAFASLPPAKSMAELAKAKERQRRRCGSDRSEHQASPCRGRRRSIADVNGGKVFQASVPADWTSLPSKSAIKVVPQNGYGQLNGQTVFSLRRRVRRREGRVARSAGSDERLAEGGRRRTIPQLRVAGEQQADTNVSALGYRHAARQSLAARRPGTPRRLDDISCRRQPVLLPDDRAGERRRGVSGDVPAHRRIDPFDGSAVTTERPSVGEGAHLVLYDGVCGLCNRLIQYLLEHDRRSAFTFASLQSAAGTNMVKRFGGNPNELTSFCVVADYRTSGAQMFSKSRAALFVAGELGWPWKLVQVARVLPRPLRDSLYDLVARHRYRIFGRYEQCLMPSEEERALRELVDWKNGRLED